MPIKTRTDCPRFKGWVALDWFTEKFLPDDRYVRFNDEGHDNYTSPEKGYMVYGGYDGPCSTHWSEQRINKCAVYRKVAENFDPYVSRCSPIPMNVAFSGQLPLP